MLHELEQTEPDDKTDVAHVFPELAQQIRRRGMIVLLSDLFLPIPTLAESLKQFRLRKHEVIVFHVMHDDELTFPFDDNTLFRGLEDCRSASCGAAGSAARLFGGRRAVSGRRAEDLRQPPAWIMC